MGNSYQNEQTKLYLQRINEILSELPTFFAEYFRSMANKNLSVRTRYSYAIDLRGFIQFLISEIPSFALPTISEFSLEDLRKIRAEHIEMFLDYVTVYEKDSMERMNRDRARARKLAALRACLKYYFKTERLESNVAALVETPKIHEHAIVRLEAHEVANLLDRVDSGENLSERQKKYHQATRVRDIAILTLFLGTGIRISELVGIDCGDIDFDNDTFLVIRKGGKEDILAFGSEVKRALSDYALQREQMVPLDGHESAFFLSLQNRRITVRAVENLVKKYASASVPLKKITPHKLRSTYGTMLYQESHDIYLVADVLGHKDVNTTRKHYAAQAEDNRRTAAKMIRLREDEPTN